MRGRRPAIVPWVVLAAVLAATALAAVAVRAMVAERDRVRFARAADITAERIESRLETYVAMLRATRGLFEDRGLQVDAEQFARFVASLELSSRHPGFQNVAFARRVQPGQEPAFEQRMRAEGDAEFRIWPASDHPHAVIELLYPRDRRNRAALGFDMASEPARREALERAQRTGEAAATRRVVLVQEIEAAKQAGFVIYLPVADLAGDGQLFGWVCAAFRGGDLFNALFPDGEFAGVAVAIHDGAVAGEDALLYRSTRWRADALQVAYRPMTIAGTRWTVGYASTTAFEAESGSGAVLAGVVGGGAALALLLFALVRTLVAGRIAAEAAAERLAQAQAAQRSAQVRTRAMIEHALDAVIGMDADGRIVEWNPQAEAVFGWTRDEALGRDLAETIIPPRLRARHRAGLVRWRGTGRSTILDQRIELSGLRRDGSEFPVELSISADVVDGQVLFIGFLRDIAASVVARDRARVLIDAGEVLSGERDYERALERLAELAVPRVADWCTVDLLQGDGALHRVAVRHRDPARAELAVELRRRYPPRPEDAEFTVLRTGQPIIAERIDDHGLQAYARDDEHLAMLRTIGLCSCVMVPFGARGRMLGVLTLLTAESARRFTAADVPFAEDLARRAAHAVDNALLLRQAEAALMDLGAKAEDLARSNADLQQFAFVTSHDLKEPLRMVSVYIDLLRRRYADRLGEEEARWMAYAVEGATRMHALLDDILVYTRLGREAEAPAEPVELERVLDEVLADLVVAIAEAGARIERAPLPIVAGDRARLRLVLQNLIANAVKFRRAGVAPVVRVAAERDGDRWRLCVADNGIGIDPAHHERVFQVFQRLHTRTQYAGTGIGLAIVKKIVEGYGGRVWVSGNDAGGTTICCTLRGAD